MFGVFLLELLNPSFSIKQFLLPGKKGMTLGTYIDMYGLLCRYRGKGLSTGAYSLDFLHFWMNFFFHSYLRILNIAKGGRILQ